MTLPGVTQLADGRIQYSTTLALPKEPKPPFTDSNTLKQAGLEALLTGENAEVVGQRIEAALRQDLGIELRFVDKSGAAAPRRSASLQTRQAIVRGSPRDRALASATPWNWLAKPVMVADKSVAWQAKWGKTRVCPICHAVLAAWPPGDLIR